MENGNLRSMNQKFKVRLGVALIQKVLYFEFLASWFLTQKWAFIVFQNLA